MLDLTDLINANDLNVSYVADLKQNGKDYEILSIRVKDFTVILNSIPDYLPIACGDVCYFTMDLPEVTKSDRFKAKCRFIEVKCGKLHINFVREDFL